MVSIGFTGSRSGPTPAQMSHIEYALECYPKITEIHHGDCIGCDQWFHMTALIVLRKRRVAIHIHPPDNPRYRAFCHQKMPNKGSYIIVHAPAPYLRRNQNIVEFSEVLMACPSSQGEVVRSGTWATIRRARKKGIPIYIFYPDGMVGLQ